MDSDFEELKKITEENYRLNQEMFIRVEKIEKYLKWQKIWAILRILIIVIPIILSLIFLPPLLRQVFEGYGEILNLSNTKIPL